MGLLSFISERKKSLFWFLGFLAVGTAAALALIPREITQLNWEVPGDPDDYPLVYQLRPWLVGAGCYLPALGALLMSFAGTLDRYMARHLLSCLMLTTSIIFLIWLLGDFSENVSEISSMDSPLKGMVRFYANQIPMVLSLILPYSLLLATLWSLSTLSRNCEITPMLQSGRGLLRVTMPLIIIGFFVSLYTTIFNYQWAPSATLYRRLTFDDISREKNRKRNKPVDPIIYKNDLDNRIWSIGEFPPLNKPDEPFKDVHIEQFSAPGKLKVEYFAESARWQPRERDWVLSNVSVRWHPDDRREIPFFEEEVAAKMILPYRETPWLLITPGVKIDTRSVPDLVTHLDEHSLNAKDRMQFRTHKYLRFAQGFSSFILVLLAIPGGITFSRRAGLSGIGIALGLSGCMIFGFEVFPSLASAGYLPPYLGAWLPDIIFLCIAFGMFYRRLAHRSLSDFLPWRRKKAETGA